MIKYTIAFCAMSLFSALSTRAEDTKTSFPKVDVIYDVTYVAHNDDDGLPHTVRILEAAGDGWFRIEYIFRRKTSASSSPNTFKTEPVKQEMWLNFSNLVSAKITPKDNSSFTDFSQ